MNGKKLISGICLTCSILKNATCNRGHNLIKFEIIYCYPPRSYFKGQMRKWNNDVIHYLLVCIF